MVKAGYEVTIHSTQDREDAMQKVKNEAKNYDLVICSGGDGTLDEAVTGMMQSEKKVPLGYIPAGSTNDSIYYYRNYHNSGYSRDAVPAPTGFRPAAQRRTPGANQTVANQQRVNCDLQSSKRDRLRVMWDFLFNKPEGIYPDNPVPAIKTDFRNPPQFQGLDKSFGHSLPILQLFSKSASC